MFWTTSVGDGLTRLALNSCGTELRNHIALVRAMLPCSSPYRLNTLCFCSPAVAEELVITWASCPHGSDRRAKLFDLMTLIITDGGTSRDSFASLAIRDALVHAIFASLCAEFHAIIVRVIAIIVKGNDERKQMYSCAEVWKEMSTAMGLATEVRDATLLCKSMMDIFSVCSLTKPASEDSSETNDDD